MAILLSTSLFVLRLKALSGSELSICFDKLLLRGLAWRLWSWHLCHRCPPVKLLGNQMAGPNWGWQRLLVYALSPLPVPVSSSCWHGELFLCGHFHSFRCYLPCYRPLKRKYLPVTLQCIGSAWNHIILEEAYDMAVFRESFKALA